MNPPDIENGWLYGFGAVLSVAFVWIRRQRTGISGDNKQIAEDGAKTGLISRLQSERDAAKAEAEEVRRQRTHDAETIARQAAEIAYLRGDLSRVMAEMRKRTRGLPDDVRRIVDTGFVDLDDDQGKK